jgi:hypothetical protein
MLRQQKLTNAENITCYKAKHHKNSITPLTILNINPKIMKKVLSSIMLSAVFIALSISVNAGCPAGSAGVCVAHYDSEGKIDYYTCSDGATSAPKDCATGVEEPF